MVFIGVLDFPMEKESKAVYQNDNEEFDEELELYRKEKKSNTRKIKILSSIFVVILFIILINPFKTLKSIEKPELEERWIDGEEVSCLKGSDTPYTGKQITYFNGQKKEEANFKDGKLDGLQVAWYENGQKWSEINFKDGKENGLKTTWYENGQKQSEINFKNGEPEGLGFAWHRNGQKAMEGMVENGKEVSQKFWNSKGESVNSFEETGLK